MNGERKAKITKKKKRPRFDLNPEVRGYRKEREMLRARADA